MDELTSTFVRIDHDGYRAHIAKHVAERAAEIFEMAAHLYRAAILVAA
ncbi:hypothetical protein [Bradyrhizobium sp. 62B]